MTLKCDAKFKGKLTCGLKNDVKNWVNLHASSRKSKICTLIGSFCSKQIKIWMKKYRRAVSWHWRVMQCFMKNWLLVPKIKLGILWILIWAVASLKICTLMCYFCGKYVTSELKKYRGVVLWKMTYHFKNDIRNLANFHTSSWKYC